MYMDLYAAAIRLLHNLLVGDFKLFWTLAFHAYSSFKRSLPAI